MFGINPILENRIKCIRKDVNKYKADVLDIYIQ